MPDRLIFVSCVQQTEIEKSMGRAVKESIDSVPGFAAYYADGVQSLTALRDHVFSAVQRSAGAVVLLHHRGEGRSSLWVNQEIAMLADRRERLSRSRASPPEERFGLQSQIRRAALSPVKWGLKAKTAGG